LLKKNGNVQYLVPSHTEETGCGGEFEEGANLKKEGPQKGDGVWGGGRSPKRKGIGTFRESRIGAKGTKKIPTYIILWEKKKKEIGRKGKKLAKNFCNDLWRQEDRQSVKKGTIGKKKTIWSL